MRPLSQVDGVHMSREVTEWVEFLRTKLATERLLLCVHALVRLPVAVVTERLAATRYSALERLLLLLVVVVAAVL